MMRRKIVFSIVTCVLLSTSFNVFAKTIEKNLTQEYNELSKNIIEWSVGHFWEYNMTLIFDLSTILTFGIYVEAVSNNLIVTVSEISNNYLLKISGDAVGHIDINRARFGSVSKISGNAIIEKETFAIKSYKISITGLASNLIPFDFYYTFEFTPSFNYLNLPINEGDDPWNVNTVAHIVLGGQSIGTKFPYEDIQDKEISTTISLSNIEEITTPAGNFYSYLLQGNKGIQSEIYYAPDARNIVKILEIFPLTITLFDEFGISIEGDLKTTYDMILKKTNFDLSNLPPNIPNPPNGNINGKSGEEYAYEVSTVDNEGEQIFYMFDWGDGLTSNWLGPYESGEICEVKHKWEERGNYKIMVKAKDIHDCETIWSEPLAVTMPKNRIKNQFILEKDLILNLLFFLKNIHLLY